MTQDARDQALVDAIAARVTDAVLQRLDGLLPPRAERRLSAADTDALAKLLPVMWRVCGVATFAIAELLAHAQQHPELQAAIRAATGREPALAARTLGRLFLRAAGAAVEGLQVHRIGDAGGAALWGLGFTPVVARLGFQGFQTPSKPKLAETREGRSPTTAA